MCVCPRIQVQQKARLSHGPFRCVVHTYKHKSTLIVVSAILSLMPTIAIGIITATAQCAAALATCHALMLHLVHRIRGEHALLPFKILNSYILF